jgi:hypothetical protein
MPTEVKTQAISGVAIGYENTIEAVYPSLAASGFGRLLGRMCDSIPVRIGGVKLSNVLFGPIAALFALPGYLAFKAFGDRYIVTNQAVEVRQILGGRLAKRVALSDIASVVSDVQNGQQFYHAGDLHVLGAKGEPLLILRGVPRPERFRRVILDARESRLRNDASLRNIQARAKA